MQAAPSVVGYGPALVWHAPGRTETSSLNRTTQRVLAALLIGLLVALGAFAPVAAASRVPKVALIVGPVGDTITPRYKALANEAAAAYFQKQMRSVERVGEHSAVVCHWE